ncbi:MAG: FkbM family methyltransferase [Gammaproteobacteria bacterium]|nr:FkbM family methyltransferase [Gammaproteobacteria bacterium]MDX2486839.1 FkbM family methyltransferase [Gammaproteobacteria bacterium]
MSRKIHKFDNNVRVYDDHLMPAQRQRYMVRNVHEADEEDLFIKIISSIPENGCFVNIGTAIGYYAILAKKLSPRLNIHAVEPLQSFRSCFNENLLLNELTEVDFVIHPCAVGATNGRVSFLEKGYESQLLINSHDQKVTQQLAKKMKNQIKSVLGSLGVKRYAAGSGRKSETDAVTLEALVNQVGQQVDLMSMDVQGLELDILSGGESVLEKAVVKTFIIGTHGKSIHQQCIHMLKNKNYSIEYEEENTQHQPDGIIVASKGVLRLSS